MKLAIITSSFPVSRDDGAAAAGLFVRDFALALAQEGHDVHVVTQRRGSGACELDGSIDGITIHRFDWRGGDRTLSRLKLYRPKDARAAWSYFAGCKESINGLHTQIGVDHVLAMWAAPAGILAKGLWKKSKVPYSVWCLGSDIWGYGRVPVLKRVVSMVLRGAQIRYADGLALRDEAQKLCDLPVAFLPSSRTLPQPTPAHEESARTQTRFLFIGRYDRVKGVDVLLDAMRIYHDRGRAGTLQMRGGGNWDQHVRELVGSLGLQNAVDVGGYADGDLVVSSLQDCDILVIPSRIESIPLVLSDALKQGKPVIVSDVGDMGELLREIPAGFVVPPEDAIALADAMEEFHLSQPGRFKESIDALAGRFDLRSAAKRFISDIHPSSPAGVGP